MNNPCTQQNHQPSELPRHPENRRSALLRLSSLVTVFFAGIRSSFAQKRLALGLDKAEKLKEVGGFAILKVQDKDILFIRDTEETVRALNPVCSHKKCLVTYISETKRIACPCHGSNYDLDGKVLKGPSEKPLQVYEATLDLPKARVIFTLEP
jgi:Rieske Fe-S protein